jgi:hypothetical protein
MGNLRDSMTDEEWDEINESIDRDRRNGKPGDGFISIYVESLTLDQLLDLKSKLDSIDVYSLGINRWIEFKTKQ